MSPTPRPADDESGGSPKSSGRLITAEIELATDSSTVPILPRSPLPAAVARQHSLSPGCQNDNSILPSDHVDETFFGHFQSTPNRKSPDCSPSQPKARKLVDYYTLDNLEETSTVADPSILEKADTQPAKIKESPSKNPYYSITQISQIDHLGSTIGIFTDSSRFFFEPLVLLDPNITVNESQGLSNRFYVRLTIQIWTTELRSRVLKHLQTLPDLSNFNIHEDDVSVMPYKELKLICNPSKSLLLYSIRVTDGPSSYCGTPESIDFFLQCDLLSAANAWAEEFRRDPEFALIKLQLELECRGLGDPERIKVSVFPRDDSKNLLRQIKDLKGEIEAERKKNLVDSSAVPVFSVLQCTNPSAKLDESLGYATHEIEVKVEHGDFDLKTGLFTVSIPGIYQFFFSSNVDLIHYQIHGVTQEVELRVDGIPKATSYCVMDRPFSGSVDYVPCRPIRLSCLLSLKCGETVGVYVTRGNLTEDPPIFTTRFSGLLFVPNSTQ